MTSGFCISWDGWNIVADRPSTELDFKAVDTAAAEEHGVTHQERTWENGELRVTCHERTFPVAGVRETWAEARCIGSRPVLVRRFDSFRHRAPDDHRTLRWFTSEWGREFTPVRVQLESDFSIENRRGRSSAGVHPWCCLSRNSTEYHGRDDGPCLAIAVAWSGNWIVRFSRDGDGFVVSGGLNDWEFSRLLATGDSLEGAHVILVEGQDLDDTAGRFASWGRRWWYPDNAAARQMPVEWNHWWSYEDKEIDETVFSRNVDAAAAMGLEICTLDAGWFGAADGATNWSEQRGDWETVNTARFPSGIRALSDHAHRRGVKFGIWCEIESLGNKARLRQERPELEALRGGVPLGYVCFGCPETRAWALGQLERLIVDYRADWIKLDFNLDPGAGCNRADHGHQGGDGLYEHYRGYYEVLDSLRAAHPDVILENCSSGGLRIDLGIMRHTHATYLSDPDWSEHNLQLFWGATLMLPPERCLHWPWSQTRRDENGRFPFPGLQLAGVDHGIEPWRLAFHLRVGMLGWYGYSHKLPDLEPGLRSELARHAEFYKTTVRRFVREAALHRLTGQPLRGGGGDRWCAFQYLMPGAGEALVFVFRLPGAAPDQRIRLKGLREDGVYRIQDLDTGSSRAASASELSGEGILLSGMREEESRVYQLTIQ